MGNLDLYFSRQGTIQGIYQKQLKYDFTHGNSKASRRLDEDVPAESISLVIAEGSNSRMCSWWVVPLSGGRIYYFMSKKQGENTN